MFGGNRAKNRPDIRSVCLRQMSEDLRAEVKQVLSESREKRISASESALDFSYLVDLNCKTRLARTRFEVDRDDKLAETLCLIRLVVESCKEAGALLLEIELKDGQHCLLLSVHPKSGSASIDHSEYGSAELVDSRSFCVLSVSRVVGISFLILIEHSSSSYASALRRDDVP